MFTSKQLMEGMGLKAKQEFGLPKYGNVYRFNDDHMLEVRVHGLWCKSLLDLGELINSKYEILPNYNLTDKERVLLSVIDSKTSDGEDLYVNRDGSKGLNIGTQCYVALYIDNALFPFINKGEEIRVSELKESV